MATTAASLESTKVSSEEFWRLAFEIQSAGLRRLEAASFDESDFDAYVRSHRLFEAVRSIADPPVSVAIRAGEERLDGSLVELLQQTVATLESQSAALTDELRCSFESLDAVRRAVHGYLNDSLIDESEQTMGQRGLEQAMYNFAYGLSHEINNPLANIAARARQLCSEINDSRQQKSLTTIADSAMKAHEMLAEMMLAVQLPAIHGKPDDLRSLLVTLSREWEGLAAERQIQWQESICDEFLWSRFDRTAMREALFVAVRNAFDACRSGDSVELVAERVESESGQLEIRVAILDNGPGLTESALSQAWDLYYSGREAGRGLGIGLAKLRRVIEAHSGTVRLESKNQAGCSVEIRLPWESRRRTR